MSDELEDRLRGIKSDLPKPRPNLSLNDLVDLARRVGPRLTRDIVKAKSQLKPERIPFIFNHVDSQDIVDILNYEMDEAIQSLLDGKSSSK